MNKPQCAGRWMLAAGSMLLALALPPRATAQPATAPASDQPPPMTAPGDDGDAGPEQRFPRRDGMRGDGRRGDGMRGDGYRDGPRGDGSPGDRFRGALPPMDPAATEEEIAEALEWSRENFPVRSGMFDRLPPGSRTRQGLLPRLVHRYRNMKRLQEQDSNLYDRMMQQQRLQDEAFGFVLAMESADEQEQAKLQEDLQKHAEQIIELNLQEREQRINRLEKALEDQKRQLEQDRQNRRALIDQQIDRLESEGREVLGRFQRRWQGPRAGPPER